MQHPLFWPREREALQPPINPANLAGWKRYRAVAQRWLTDLQHHAAGERGKGAVSAETQELLDDARGTIEWADQEIGVLNFLQSDDDDVMAWLLQEADDVDAEFETLVAEGLLS